MEKCDKCNNEISCVNKLDCVNKSYRDKQANKILIDRKIIKEKNDENISNSDKIYIKKSVLIQKITPSPLFYIHRL